MDDAIAVLFLALVCLLVSAGVTWEVAHSTVAHECDKLGAFYVGDAVYECKKKDQP